MTERWVDVKSWDELKVKDRIRDIDGEYTITKILPDTVYVIFFTTGQSGHDNRDEFYPGKYQRLITTAGHWEDLKSWGDLKVGDRMKQDDLGEKEIQSISPQSYQGSFDTYIGFKDGTGILFNSKSDPQDPMLKTQKWIPDDDDTGNSDFDPWKTLRQSCAPVEEAPTKKQIPKWPHRCHHCGAPSYNGEWSIDCSGNCEASKT
jgi:hypothetical protein